MDRGLCLRADWLAPEVGQLTWSDWETVLCCESAIAARTSIPHPSLFDLLLSTALSRGRRHLDTERWISQTTLYLPHGSYSYYGPPIDLFIENCTSIFGSGDHLDPRHHRLSRSLRQCRPTRLGCQHFRREICAPVLYSHHSKQKYRTFAWFWVGSYCILLSVVDLIPVFSIRFWFGSVCRPRWGGLQFWRHDAFLNLSGVQYLLFRVWTSRFVWTSPLPPIDIARLFTLSSISSRWLAGRGGFQGPPSLGTVFD